MWIQRRVVDDDVEDGVEEDMETRENSETRWSTPDA